MNSGTFLINDEFKVQPELNLVTVVSDGATTRLEPRLMKLLCLLTNQPGFVISRAQIINIIWDNYGGGDEGLTQAISFLRKTLKDTDKCLITTISKRGYQFNGVITQPATVMKQPRDKRWLYMVTAAALTVVIGLSYIVGKAPTPLQANMHRQAATDVPFSDVQSVSNESKLNTITTVERDGTKYKLFVRGDSRPRFFINNRELQPEEMEKHLTLIDQLQKQLRRRKTGVAIHGE